MNTINPQVYSLPETATSVAGITENAQGSGYGVQLPGTTEGLEAATQYNGIPETGSLEQLAGVPTAAELSALANSLFPDLTGELGNLGINYEPEVCAEGIDNLIEKGDPKVISIAENKAVTAYGHLFNEEGGFYGEYLNHAENSFGNG